MDGQKSSTDERSNKRIRIDTLDAWRPSNAEVRQAIGLDISFASPTKRLTHSDYDVGWICALDLELTAARLMLDEEHLLLPVLSASDQNCYILGAINDHNIVITCLPAGIYGKSSAALVANSMVSTFTAINTCLLVGIGGGVPSSGNDIRLGDVVVGIPTSEYPAVVQYDYGKAETDGFINKGTLDKPHPSLLAAVSKLKSSHSLESSRMHDFMIAALRRYPSAKSFKYPAGVEDILLEPDCDHFEEDCQCDNMRIAARPVRLDMAPRIFYGSIASGDQVIKDRRVRDRLARKHGIFCFEMEAAGLMDRLHALVIRGICDYCDAAKGKDFQPYAALAAAAYTKELLLQMPFRSDGNHNQPIGPSKERLKHRRKIMNALKFDTFDSRRANVRRAHPQTCSWLLDHPDYLEWAEHDRVGLSLLWLKGKPGTGKSTIMKYIHENIVKNAKENHITTAFFFNARGTEMQQSILGLYRSLLFQLLSSAPDMQHLLDTLHTDFSADALINLFRDCVCQLGLRQLVCCIDALDECPEDQAWKIVQAFESLAKSTGNQTCVRILFSSRHYPNVVMNHGKYLVLESLPGHTEDIERYIHAELNIGEDSRSNDLRNQILNRSSSIFLWVVLVVAILRKTHARGRIHELSKRLAEIPPGLDDLFRDILTRDKENLPDLLFCLQWLLYASRPLTCEELYFALKTRDEDACSMFDADDASTAQMTDFILDCSKGLVKFVRTETLTIEFIHESVREFLLTPGVLTDLYDEFKAASAEASHHLLRNFCCRQIRYTAEYIETHKLLSETILQPDRHDIINKVFPLARYSAESVLLHADRGSENSQAGFLRNFDIDRWEQVYFLTIASQDEIRSHNFQNLDLYLCRVKAFELLEARWSIQQINNEDKLKIAAYLISRGALSECALMLRAHYRSSSSEVIDMDHVNPLLEVLTDIRDHGLHKHTPFQDVFHVILNWYRRRNQTEISKALHVAMCCKRKAAISLLVTERGTYSMEGLHSIVGPASARLYGTSVGWLDINRQHNRYDEGKYEDTRQTTQLLDDTSDSMIFLLDQPRLARLGTPQMLSILHQAIEWTNSTVVETLLDIFLKFSQSFPLKSTLQWAVSLGKVSIIKLLLSRGAPLEKNLIHITFRPVIIQCLLRWGLNVNEPDAKGNTPLHLAVHHGAGRAVVFLTRVGADPNVRNCSGQTPLHLGARRERPDILVRLLWKKAKVDSIDHAGNTCLHEAAHFRQVSNIKLLLHFGAAVDCKNHAGQTPLQKAFNTDALLSAGSLSVAELLHGHGAIFHELPSTCRFQSTSVMSYMQLRAREQRYTQSSCCEFADMNTRQIYAQFCESRNAASDAQTDEEDFHDNLTSRHLINSR